MYMDSTIDFEDEENVAVNIHYNRSLEFLEESILYVNNFKQAIRLEESVHQYIMLEGDMDMHNFARTALP